MAHRTFGGTSTSARLAERDPSLRSGSGMLGPMFVTFPAECESRIRVPFDSVERESIRTLLRDEGGEGLPGLSGSPVGL